MDWSDVPIVLALAREGSVRAAGTALGVSHSTVARRIDALEKTLGTRLFDRSRDGYAPTEAGRRMVAHAERIASQMAAMERDIVGRDGRLEGPVSITCTDPIMAAFLLDALTPFCAAHPEIIVSLGTDARSFDLSHREADIAIRAVARDRSPKPHLLGTRLLPVVLASYVADAHAARLDPELPGSSPRWLGFDDRALHEHLVRRSSYPDVPIWGAFSTIAVGLAAAERGLGLVMLPTYAADPHPALRRLAKPDLQHLADFWMLSHPDLRTNARLAAVRRCIADALVTHLPLFRGDCPADAPFRPAAAPEESDAPAVP